MKNVQIDQVSTRSSFETLPDELILGIMMLLGFKQWMVLACVSSTMRRVSRDNKLWKCYFPSFDPTKSDELLYQKVYDVFQNKFALGLASNELKTNPEIVLAVVKKQSALQYADLALRDNPEIVNAAVKNFGWALEYASERLQNDKEIVLAAVRNHGVALQYASERRRDDKEIVLAAMKHNGGDFEYASERLQNVKDVILAATTAIRPQKALTRVKLIEEVSLQMALTPIESEQFIESLFSVIENDISRGEEVKISSFSSH